MSLIEELFDEFSERNGSLTPGQMEATSILWESGASLGLWECTEGRFPSQRQGRHEICQLLVGRASVEELASGSIVEVVAGDVLVLPDGWSGIWDVKERVRKVFVNIPA